MPFVQIAEVIFFRLSELVARPAELARGREFTAKVRAVPPETLPDLIRPDPTRPRSIRGTRSYRPLPPPPAHIMTTKNLSPRATRPPYPSAVPFPDHRWHRPEIRSPAAALFRVILVVGRDEERSAFLPIFVLRYPYPLRTMRCAISEVP